MSTVWIKFRTNLLSVLIWVQTACKDQQTTKVTTSEERVLKGTFSDKLSEFKSMITDR